MKSLIANLTMLAILVFSFLASSFISSKKDLSENTVGFVCTFLAPRLYTLDVYIKHLLFVNYCFRFNQIQDEFLMTRYFLMSGNIRESRMMCLI